MIEPIISAVLSYGIQMGTMRYRFAPVLGVTRRQITTAFMAGGSAFLFAIAGAQWWAYPAGIALAYLLLKCPIRLSWQMHASYPTDRKCFDHFMDRNK